MSGDSSTTRRPVVRRAALPRNSGITDDNQLFVLVRFESEEAARANSDKPEQGEWWAEMETLFDGEPIFHDSTDVVEESVGDRDSAGFVQVILGKTTDIDRSRELMNSDLPLDIQGVG